MRMSDVRFSCSRLVILVVFLAGFLQTMSGAAQADEIWAVGEKGATCHYDGNEWRWIVDNNYHYQAMWAFSETDIYTAASNGGIYHYDGLSWNVVYEHPGGATFNDMWAASPSDIFVAGAAGLVLHYNGIEWGDISNPSLGAVNSIYGASTGELFAACDEGVFQYSGAGWEEIPLPEEYDSWAWNAVWCGDAKDVCVATATTVLSWNGKKWSSLEYPGTTYLQDIWGVSGEVLYVVGGHHVWQYSLFYRIWSELEDRSVNTHWSTLCGISADEIYVAGEDPASSENARVAHYHASICETFEPGFNVRAINSTSSDHVYIAGDYRCFGSYDLGIWSRWTPEILEDLKEVWASPSGRVYAVSDEGGVFELNGDSWNEIWRNTDYTHMLQSIWGTSDTDIYTAGLYIYHYDGVAWEKLLTVGSMVDFYEIEDIYGTSSTNVYFCGGDWVFRYDGVAMDTIRVGSSTLSKLLGIWAYDENNVYACGYYMVYVGDVYWDYLYYPAVYYYNGSGWNLAFPPNYYPGEIQYQAIRGAGADCILTSGSAWYDRVFDGDDWVVLQQPFHGFDIWGTSRENVYFTASDGIWRYDGSAFECVAPYSLELYGICGLTDYPTPASLPALEPFLAQNYPNPFNPNTTISFSLSERQRVSVAVYDAAGRLVRVLVDGVMDAGPRDVIWDGKDNSGRGVASGIYFCRLEAGALKETKKMVLIR